MEPRAMAVAVIFGLLTGWGLSRDLDDIRPVVVALVLGIATGTVTRVVAGGDAALAGGSLILGCTAGLVGLVPKLRAG